MSEERDPTVLDARSIAIASINDIFRRTFHKRYGRVVMTCAVSALELEKQRLLIQTVQDQIVTDDGNDPYNEHDFGTVDLFGDRFFWKIDYYDKTMKYLSEDPGDIKATIRVLTIMNSSDY